MPDPYWSDVVLLCHFDGEDGATTATDESDSGHTLDFQNTAQLDTAAKKFGSASLWLPASGDTVEVANSPDWQFGDGDFTVEAWVRWDAPPSTYTGLLWHYQTSGNERSWVLQWEPGDDLTLWVSSNGSTRNSVSRDWATVVGQWYHVAATRNGSLFRCYLDGQPSNALDWDTSLHTPDIPLRIGTQPDLHIDEVRITKGVARYGASAFTPPSAAFPHGAEAPPRRPVVMTILT